MDKRKTLLFLVALSCFLLAGKTLAMDSTNYRLDWFTPLTTNGGGSVSSGNHAANFTIGQTARGSSSSTNYEVGLGYWYGVDVGEYEIYLPVVMRNYNP